MIRTLVLVLVALACRRDLASRQAIEAEEPPVFTARIIDAAVDPASAPPHVDVEVKARVVEATLDKATGTTIVTVAAGANHGVRLDWIGEVVDPAGAVAGRFTVVEVKERTTIGASPLAPKQLEGKLVRLASPPPPPP